MRHETANGCWGQTEAWQRWRRHRSCAASASAWSPDRAPAWHARAPCSPGRSARGGAAQRGPLPGHAATAQRNILAIATPAARRQRACALAAPCHLPNPRPSPPCLAAKILAVGQTRHSHQFPALQAGGAAVAACATRRRCTGWNPRIRQTQTSSHCIAGPRFALRPQLHPPPNPAAAG